MSQFFQGGIAIQTNPYINGSKISPNIISAAVAIITSNYWEEVQFVKSSGGAVNITASPQIQPGTKLGQKLTLYGTSATDTILLEDGDGLVLNGSIILTNDSMIVLLWNGFNWSEDSRNDI